MDTGFLVLIVIIGLAAMFGGFMKKKKPLSGWKEPTPPPTGPRPGAGGYDQYTNEELILIGTQRGFRFTPQMTREQMIAILERDTDGPEEQEEL